MAAPRPDSPQDRFERLVALASNELPPDEAAATGRLVERDPDTAATLDTLRWVIEALRGDDGVAPPPDALARVKARLRRLDGDAALRHRPERWWETLVAVAARLVHDSHAAFDAWEGGALPAPAGFRGVDDARQLTYEVDASALPADAAPGDTVEIELRIAPASFVSEGPERHAGAAPHVAPRCHVLGQVSSARPAGQAVALHDRGSATIVQGTTDAGGVFSLAVPPGRYDLLLGLDDLGVAVTVPDIDVP